MRNKVDMRQVTYPYVNLVVQAEKLPGNFGENLHQLYLYIGMHSNMGSPYTIGNAYRAIKKRANSSLGKDAKKISKRQVSSLWRLFAANKKESIVKIPFGAYYIFEAIFDIVKEYCHTYPLPNNLSIFINNIRRDIFYSTQCELYATWYNTTSDRKKIYDIHADLYEDLFAPSSVLSKKFK